MKHLNILIVEDLEVQRNLAAAQLRSRKYGVVAVDNGLAAIEILENGPHIDLILLDLMLDDVDGFTIMELIDRLKVQRINPKICILSGKREEQSVQRAIRNGCDAYIVKPWDKETLFAKIENLIGTSVSRRDMQTAYKSEFRSGTRIASGVVTKVCPDFLTFESPRQYSGFVEITSEAFALISGTKPTFKCFVTYGFQKDSDLYEIEAAIMNMSEKERSSIEQHVNESINLKKKAKAV